MQDPDAAIELLHRLRQLGVRLAIDDFGTGYSSLLRLKRMNVHKLKIDQGFVSGLPDDREDAAITRSVIGLAHNLGAEGGRRGHRAGRTGALPSRAAVRLRPGLRPGAPCAAEAIDWQRELMPYGQHERQHCS